MEKKDIALKQLKAAAKHYNTGDFICCITLSGAAEEILGRIAKNRTGRNQFESEIEYVKSIYNYFSGGLIDEKILIKTLNNVKNELKHNDSGENRWVEADFEMEAAKLFVKAVKNYYDSYNEFPKDRIIVDLFENLTL
jgi:hypothetical protein